MGLDLAAIAIAIATPRLGSFTFDGSLSQLKQRLGHVADGVRQDVAHMADGVSSAVATTLTATTERAIESLDYTVAQAEGVTSSIAQELWQAMAADAALWLQGHPLLSWLLRHPIVTIGLTLLVVVLVWGLLQAMAQLAQRAWIILLNIPLYLVRLAIMALGQLGQWMAAEFAAWYRRSRPPRSGSSALTADRHHPADLLQDAEERSGLQDGSNGLANSADASSAGVASGSNIADVLDLIHPVSDPAPQGNAPPLAEGDRQLIEGLKRLEALGHQQTQALQALIQHLEARSPHS